MWPLPLLRDDEAIGKADKKIIGTRLDFLKES